MDHNKAYVLKENVKEEEEVLDKQGGIKRLLSQLLGNPIKVMRETPSHALLFLKNKLIIFDVDHF